jgi:hypothetical protein
MEPIGKLQTRAAETAAAAEAARGRHGELQRELHAVNARWQAATLATITAADFAELTARRELLDRAEGAARAELGRLEAEYHAARTELAVKVGQRNREAARLTRAERNGDRPGIAAAGRALAGLGAAE